jgi:hypothetical protein
MLVGSRGARDAPEGIWAQLQCNGLDDDEKFNNAGSLLGCFPHIDHKPSSGAAGPTRTHVRPDQLLTVSCNWPCRRKSTAEGTAIPHASSSLSGRGSRRVAGRGYPNRAPGYARVSPRRRSDCGPDRVSQVPRALIVRMIHGLPPRDRLLSPRKSRPNQEQQYNHPNNAPTDPCEVGMSHLPFENFLMNGHGHRPGSSIH